MHRLLSDFVLAGTRSLNLPMFTALRRFSIFMTMLAEYYVLGSKAPVPVIISVVMMVGGALFAALFDLSFDFTGFAFFRYIFEADCVIYRFIGYLLVFMNNVFTAINGVWMKRASISGRCSKIGVLYYNSLFSAVAMMLFFSVEHLVVERPMTNFPLIVAISQGKLPDFSGHRQLVELDPFAEYNYMNAATQQINADKYNYRHLLAVDGGKSNGNSIVGNEAASSNLRVFDPNAIVKTSTVPNKGGVVPAQIDPVPVEVIEAPTHRSTLTAALAHPGWHDMEFVGMRYHW
jgi:hypothetical protein